MSIDPRNDRICYYERIMNVFLHADGCAKNAKKH